MKQFSLLGLLMFLFTFMSCVDETFVGGDSSRVVRATIAGYEMDKSTRVNFIQDLTSFNWDNGDRIGIYHQTEQSDNFVLLTIREGGSNSGYFSNSSFVLIPNATYYAFYPYNINATVSAYPIDFTGQIQTENGSTAHIGKRNYMRATVKTDNSGDACIDFINVASILQIVMDVPKSSTYTSLILTSDNDPFITNGTANMADGSITATTTNNEISLSLGDGIVMEAGDKLVINLLVAPVDMRGSKLTCRIVNSEGGDMLAIFDGRNFQAGKGYQYASSWVNETTVAVSNEAGKLKDLLGNTDLQRITKLTLSGDINFDDAVVIRKMKNLEILDMTDLNILDGGTLTKDSVFVQFRKDEYDYGMSDHWRVIDRTDPNYTWTAGKINKYMFVGMNFKKVVLPRTITEISYRAFYACGFLEEIKIPENVQTIKDDSFGYCQNLQDITIPSTVKSLSWPFLQCRNIKNIVFEQGSCSEGFFPFDSFWRNKIVNITMPDCMTYTTNGDLFRGCSLLESFTIPRSVLNARITFSEVPALKDIYLYAEPSSSLTISTSDSKAGITLHVPSGRKTEYSRYYSGFTIVDDL